ncbi:MAG: hypothetical protein V2B20_10550 [Pseudomonadota bacterium]
MGAEAAFWPDWESSLDVPEPSLGIGRVREKVLKAKDVYNSWLRLPGLAVCRPRQLVVEGVFFLFLALASTWPLARHAGDHLPFGMEEVATVPLFNVWTVWWNADRAAVGYKGYWDAPIFYPAENAFTFSEPMVLTVLAAPIIWFGANRILAYNFLIVFSIWLNGWVACRLLRRLHLYPALPWLGGAMVALSPLVHSWLGVLQLVPVFGILLTILALHRFARRPTVVYGTMLGLALALTYLMCSYYGLFLMFPLVLSSGWLLGRGILQGRMWLTLLPGILLCLVLCLPVVMAQQRALTGVEMHYSVAHLAGLSATMADYLVPPWPQLLNLEILIPKNHDPVFKLCPGVLKLGLALLGTLWGILSVRRRRWMMFCLSMAGLSFALSLGPLLQVGETRPYLFLVDYFPGFAQARNVFRFAIISHLMIALLAITGLQAGMVVIRRFIAGKTFRRVTRIAILGVGIVAAMEILPDTQPLYAVPDFAANHSWLAWLEEQTTEQSIIACLPFPLTPDVGSYQQEAMWMYWQTFHRRRMVNGYSGYFPDHFQKLKWPMAQFPAGQIVDTLLDIGVEYCVVQSNAPQGEFIHRSSRNDQRIEAVLRDSEANIDIYRLKREP